MQRLDPSHLPHLKEILNFHSQNPDAERFGFLWSDRQLEESLKKGEGWGIWDSGPTLYSFALIQELNPSLFELHLMMTHPHFARKGHMERLFQGWISMQESPWTLWLEVHKDNIEAQKFYKKLEFKKDGFRKNYYSDGGDAVLYTLKSN